MAEVVHRGRTRYVYTDEGITVEEVIARVILYLFGVLEVFIALRFALELFGANVASPFVTFVYRVSGIFMAPFIAVFPSQRVGHSIFEWSALVAMAVYALIAWGIVALLRLITPPFDDEVVERIERHGDDTDDTAHP